MQSEFSPWFHFMNDPPCPGVYETFASDIRRAQYQSWDGREWHGPSHDKDDATQISSLSWRPIWRGLANKPE